MLNHLLPRVYNDCDALNERNKENIGYFVRRPTASLRGEFDGTPVLHRRRTAYGGRRTPSPVALGGIRARALGVVAASARASTITPQDAKKKVMQMKQSPRRAPKQRARSNRCKQTATSKKATARSQSLSIIRRPLQDITHLYVNERASIAAWRRERAARDAQSTSVAMRFY